MASRSSSKSKSLSKASLLNFSSRLSLSGGTRELSRVSWKRLAKRSPWLKQLRKHQKKGTAAIVSTNGFAALFEQRTGKTWVTGAVLCVEFGESLDVLLVGPLTNLESTWGKFLAEKLPWYTVHRDLESYDKHQKEFVKAWGHRDHCILMLNPEKITKSLLGKLKRRKWDRFIWDESQRLKNRSSKSSRDAYQIARSCRKRLALTGTPMDLDPKDLWALLRFVDEDRLGEYANWGRFESYFLVQPKIDVKKKGVIARKRMMLAYQIAKRKAPMREDRIDEFAELCAPAMMRITKEEAGIERANIHVCKFKLDPQEDKKYRQLEKKMVVKVKGVVVKTPLKITKIGKLQQMTGGHLKDEDGEVHVIGTSKRRFLRKLIQEHDDRSAPIAVFCKYVWEVHMLARFLRRMGYSRVAELWGKVKDIKRDKRRTNMLLGFQRGEFDAIVCQQRTGGVGVDLYRARKFFVFSMGHSFIDYDQMISRGDFLDQDVPADFFLPMADQTIDTDIHIGVNKKKSISDVFYQRLKKGT